MLVSGGAELSFSGSLLAASALLLAVAVSEAPPHQSRNTAVIAGVVVDGTTGQPLSGAAVSLAPAYFTETVSGLRIELPMDAARAEARGADQPRRILTGADGSFRFTGLRGGRYRIEVVRRGYWPSMAGRDQPIFDGRRLRLEPTVVSPGTSLTDVTIRAWPLGAVEGQVTDADGEPLAGVGVQLTRPL